MEPDDLQPIVSPEDAELVALRWARANDLAIRDFKGFAQEWHRGTSIENRVRVNLRSYLQSFVSVCRHYEAEWSSRAVLLEDLTSNWNLETVKHLAVLNVAGLAGGAALLTNATYASQFTSRLALILFGCGLVFALLTMWCNTRGYAIARSHARNKRNATIGAKLWTDVAQFLESEGGRFTSLSWFWAAETTGWISALLGIGGLVSLGGSLL